MWPAGAQVSSLCPGKETTAKPKRDLILTHPSDNFFRPQADYLSELHLTRPTSSLQ
jgi:hypothetical protein